MYNMATIAGHVEIDDGVIISSHALAHQFVRIGKLAYVGAQARAKMDVPPFMTAVGDATVVSHNVVGMTRAGYTPEALQEIREAYRTLYRSGLLFTKAVEQLAPPPTNVIKAGMQTEKTEAKTQDEREKMALKITEDAGKTEADAAKGQFEVVGKLLDIDKAQIEVDKAKVALEAAKAAKSERNKNKS